MGMVIDKLFRNQGFRTTQMKKINLFCFFFFLLNVTDVFAQLRSFNNIFPNLNEAERNAAFSEAGFVNHSRAVNRLDLKGTGRAGAALDHSITNTILVKNPGFVVETILVLQRDGRPVPLLDVYNALSNVKELKGRLYDSASRSAMVPLFEDATRIISERQTTPIPDPPPALVVPERETVFIRLKDANFGNSFYRGDMRKIQNGLSYTLTNFRNLTYFFVPVIREGNLTAQLYFEPITEGLLIYGIAGAEVADFFSSRISMNSAISKRLGVIISWVSDGILGK